MSDQIQDAMLSELKQINQFLGVMSLNIKKMSDQLNNMSSDVELMKVNIKHLKKQDNSPDPNFDIEGPKSYIPPTENSI